MAIYTCNYCGQSRDDDEDNCYQVWIGGTNKAYKLACDHCLAELEEERAVSCDKEERIFEN